MRQGHERITAYPIPILYTMMLMTHVSHDCSMCDRRDTRRGSRVRWVLPGARKKPKPGAPPWVVTCQSSVWWLLCVLAR